VKTSTRALRLLYLTRRALYERTGRISPIFQLSDVDLRVANFCDFRSISFICTTIRASSIANSLATFMGQLGLLRFEFCEMRVRQDGLTELESDEIL